MSELGQVNELGLTDSVGLSQTRTFYTTAAARSCQLPFTAREEKGPCGASATL